MIQISIETFKSDIIAHLTPCIAENKKVMVMTGMTTNIMFSPYGTTALPSNHDEIELDDLAREVGGITPTLDKVIRGVLGGDAFLLNDKRRPVAVITSTGEMRAVMPPPGF
jgi:hypothetical protein